MPEGLIREPPSLGSKKKTNTLEDAIYDRQAMRFFAGIDLRVEAVPDATTLLKFRHLLEAHALTQQLLLEETYFGWVLLASVVKFGIN